ncbi:MAG: rhomboid family intramembrane serine protease [Planctomycetota bacterium]|nr:rhomboid family intramembrane serine protease [Planctomycetota bacterium]
MIPIRTSISPRRTPYANYLIIAANVVVFLLSSYTRIDPYTGQKVFDLRNWAEPFMLFPARPAVWQFITYAFLHGGLMHIIGNMYFLYMFGNNVNDKLGHIGYTCFYLTGAVFSGIGHTLLHSSPVLGASGAVAAVTGAYLVLFPKSVITIVYIFFFIGTMDLSALYFILFKLIAYDNLIEPKFSAYPVAYDAHLSGYIFGVACILALLALKLIESSYNDLYAIMRQWYRRRRFSDMVSDGYDPFSARTSKVIRVREVKTSGPDAAVQEKITGLRTQIAALISGRNLTEAADMYLKLKEIDAQQVLPRQHQLDVANQLMSSGNWRQSAMAYETFLAHYGTYEYAEQVHLMLGILYCRYLNQPQKALQYLQTAREKLKNPGQIQMCEQEIADINNRIS